MARDGLTAWQVDELNDVPGDEVVDLGSADRPAKRALDHYEGSLAQHLAQFLKEVVGVGRREVPELRCANLGIDPIVCLADDRFYCVRVALDRVEPVLDAQLHGVIDGSADTLATHLLSSGRERTVS